MKRRPSQLKAQPSRARAETTDGPTSTLEIPPVRVQFHGIAAGGEGVGRDENGKTIFAPLAAPGDVGEVRVTRDQRHFAHGKLVALVESGPGRVTAPCPHYPIVAGLGASKGGECGGCQLQHLTRTAQLEAKRRVVADSLIRIGGLTGLEVEPVRAGWDWNYRNKADFVVGTTDAGPVVGYFAPASHDLVDIEACPLLRAELNELLASVRAHLNANPHWAFDAHSGRGDLRRVVVRVSTEGETLITLVTARPRWDDAEALARALRAAHPELRGVLSRGPREAPRVVAGRGDLVERIAGLEFRCGGDAFFQVNPEVTAGLVKTVVELVGAGRGANVLDLFCGVGLFGLALARAGARVTGIESHPGAVADAIHNASANRLRATFREGDALRELDRFAPGSFGLVVLDPPRSGAPGIAAKLARLGPARVVYISCDPATLARDARALGELGFRAERAVPFDLFPQTAHVETVISFVRE